MEDKTYNLKIWQRLTFKVGSIIVIILLIGIGTTVYYYLNSQNETIVKSRLMSIKQESDILATAIKNSMLAGEAPIAVHLFRDFGKSDFKSKIELFRTNGETAFSDNETVKGVNLFLGENRFSQKKILLPYRKSQDKNIFKAVSIEDDLLVQDIEGKNKKVIVYNALSNQPACASCHNNDHVVRGVLKISISVDDVYTQTRKNTIYSAIIYVVVVLILTLAIILFLHRTVIRNIFHLSNVVEKVGQGEFNVKVNLLKRDEIGLLGNHINHMIDGLVERLKLSKFVSKSTMNQVAGDDVLALGGVKKNMTVLFSDIRGFTKYSENTEPEKVLENLNKIMDLQSGIVYKHNGDIDKYVGDEMMAIFEGEGMVSRAMEAAREIVQEMRIFNESAEEPFYVGIGINTGEMVSGNMGSLDRIDHTVIGDAVNLGARLCSIAGKNTILISQYSYSSVKEDFPDLRCKSIHVKGKEAAIKVYIVPTTEKNS